MNSVRAASIPDSTGAPEARRRHTRSTGISGITLLSTLSTVLLVVSCGGRIELIPLPQIGHLSDDAVMASDSGVRVMVRSDAWPGNVIALPGIVPLENTIDNRSGRSLRIGHVHFALVQNGNRITAMAPTDAERLAAIRPVPKDIVERALPNGILDADERVRGFVYFPPIDESDEVTLVVDLVDSSTASPFGAIRIPFSAE